MLKKFKKYFWDGNIDSFSPQFRVSRIFEYASFPDLIKYPIDEVKREVGKIAIEQLRVGESRKKFLLTIKPYLQISGSWDEAIKRYVKEALGIDSRE